MVEETQFVTLDDEHIAVLSNYMVSGQPSTKSDIQKEE